MSATDFLNPELVLLLLLGAVMAALAGREYLRILKGDPVDATDRFPIQEESQGERTGTRSVSTYHPRLESVARAIAQADAPTQAAFFNLYTDEMLHCRLGPVTFGHFCDNLRALLAHGTRELLRSLSI